MTSEKVYLKLQNGEVFEGRSFGSEGPAAGEVVFVTSMAGYLEVLTDPVYQGQIVVQTFPLIGNYGVISGDFEGGRPRLAGYVVREVCDFPSNFRSEGNLSDYLKKSGVTGVCDIDTRQITRVLREHGTMRGAIVKDKDAPCGFYAEKQAAAAEKTVPETSGAGLRIVYLDFGGRRSAISELVSSGFEVLRVGAMSTEYEILGPHPKGVVVGEGAGDPKDYPQTVAVLKKLLGKIPILGVGLGHQLVALAAGGDTQKMKTGHRGSNCPVRCKGDGKAYITEQSHGYEVVAKSLKGKGEELFVNINDNTNEGVLYRAKNAFTVQFRPLPCIYEKFAEMTEGKEYAD